MKSRWLLMFAVCVLVVFVIYALHADARKAQVNAQLASASANGDLSMVSKLLGDGANLNSQTSGTGFTPLHWAAYQEQFEVVKLLLDKGADPRIKDRHGETVADLLKKTTAPEAAQLLESLARGSEESSGTNVLGAPVSKQ